MKTALSGAQSRNGNSGTFKAHEQFVKQSESISAFETYRVTPKTNSHGAVSGVRRVYRGGSWKSRLTVSGRRREVRKCRITRTRSPSEDRRAPEFSMPRSKLLVETTTFDFSGGVDAGGPHQMLLSKRWTTWTGRSRAIELC